MADALKWVGCFFYPNVLYDHRTNTFVILNSELPCELCEGSFLRSKIYIIKSEGNFHYRNVDAATLFKVGAIIDRPPDVTILIEQTVSVAL